MMARRLSGLGLTLSTSIGAKARPARRELFAADVSGARPADVLLLVGDKSGRLMGELRGELVGAAWKLNAYGQARITMAREDATARRELLAFGNRLLIQFGNGLPDWGGVIDTPRKGADGRIEVVGYSGEYLLTWRMTDRGRYFNRKTAGEIFRSLLTEAEPVGVEVGTVWLGGEPHSPDYHYRELYDIFTKSVTGRLEEADWNVSAALLNGSIRFRANLFERRGTDHGKRLALIDGANAAVARVDEQGAIVNAWRMAGAGTGWGESNRIYATAEDEESQGNYGLRQKGEVRVDVVEQGTLDANAANELERTKRPRAVASVTAWDAAPGRFREYDVGDTVWLESYGTGFDGYAAAVRVKAREFLAERGVCSLVIE